MPKFTRIYTRTGDAGTTGLVGGERIRKSAPRIDAYGTIDELSSAIGVARSSLHDRSSMTPRAQRLDAWLGWIQDVLFSVGTDLATPAQKRWESMPSIAQSDVDALERAIDEAQALVPPLDQFIHPGGSPAGAQLHLARTICRRAERLLVALVECDRPVAVETLRYMNRLSDALFVWARWINAEENRSEDRWKQQTAPPA